MGHHSLIYIKKIRKLYLDSQANYISDVNLKFITAICEILAINTKISLSKDYCSDKFGKTERLVQLCTLAGANEYLSGPSAAAYINADLFEAAGIKLLYADYSNYPTYEQSFGKFEHGVTILDLLFHTGLRARGYMKNM